MRAPASSQMRQVHRGYGRYIKGVIPLSELIKYVHRKGGAEVWAYKVTMAGIEGYNVVGPGGGTVRWTKELFDKVYKPCS